MKGDFYKNQLISALLSYTIRLYLEIIIIGYLHKYAYKNDNFIKNFKKLL